MVKHLCFTVYYKKNPEKSLYIDFEDERLKSIILDELEKIKETFFELNPHLVKEKVIFLFDEIQNIQGWKNLLEDLLKEKT